MDGLSDIASWRDWGITIPHNYKLDGSSDEWLQRIPPKFVCGKMLSHSMFAIEARTTTAWDMIGVTLVPLYFYWTLQALSAPVLALAQLGHSHAGMVGPDFWATSKQKGGRRHRRNFDEFTTTHIDFILLLAISILILHCCCLLPPKTWRVKSILIRHCCCHQQQVHAVRWKS